MLASGFLKAIGRPLPPYNVFLSRYIVSSDDIAIILGDTLTLVKCQELVRDHTDAVTTA